MHTVWRVKIVWTVLFEGVIGEANLVSWLLVAAAVSFKSVVSDSCCYEARQDSLDCAV